MKVLDILEIKGSVVKTVRPDTSARELSVQLRAEQIGAMIVSSDGRSIDGIVSERDLAYALATHGGGVAKAHCFEAYDEGGCCLLTRG